jgi:hypothetical protein
VRRVWHRGGGLTSSAVVLGVVTRARDGDGAGVCVVLVGPLGAGCRRAGSRVSGRAGGAVWGCAGRGAICAEGAWVGVGCVLRLVRGLIGSLITVEVLGSELRMPRGVRVESRLVGLAGASAATWVISRWCSRTGRFAARLSVHGLQVATFAASGSRGGSARSAAEGIRTRVAGLIFSCIIVSWVVFTWVVFTWVVRSLRVTV